MSRRYQVLVNGFAVSVPYARAARPPRRRRPSNRVYPSYTYRLNLNRGPAVLGAPAFSSLTGARGRGRQGGGRRRRRRPRASVPRPDRLLVPTGLPEGRRRLDDAEGDRRARVRRAGANSSPLDRDRSFHGTHVAGIIAGVKTDVAAGPTGFCIEASGGCHPAVDDLEGVAPRAYIGNYRVFNVPAPSPLGGCCSANSPEIVAAFEAAVRDGMDIINFSGGGPAGGSAHGRPHRGGRERRSRRRRADHLGRQRPRLLRARDGGLASHGARRDQRGAVANAHVFGPSISVVVSPGGFGRMPFAPPTTSRRRGSRPTSGSSTSGSIGGVNRQLCGAALRGIAARRDRARRAAAAVRTPRRRLVRAMPARRGWSSPRTGPAIRPSRSSPALRAARSPTSTVRGFARLRPDARRLGHRPLHARHARSADDLGGRADELLGRRAHAVREGAQARRDGARARRSSPRRCPSSRATSSPSSTGRASRRRTSPARRRCSRSATRPGRRSR